MININRQLLFITVLNAPLITEVLRRFFIQGSNIALLFLDLLILTIGIVAFVVVQHRLSLSRWMLYWTFVIVVWWIVSVIVTHQSLLIGIVGLRIVLLPFFALVIGAAYWGDLRQRLITVVKTISFWIALATIVGFIQLLLGPSHPFSLVPTEIGGSQGGIDVYGGAGMYIPFLFRPTSFFMHTGKFGQAMFVLVLFQLITKQELKLKGALWTLVVWLGILGVIISGQRAAGLFLVLSYIVYKTILSPFSFRRKKLKLPYHSGLILKTSTIFLVIAVFPFVVMIIGDNPIAKIIFRRFVLLENLLPRVESHLWIPFKELMERFFVIGMGAGYLTLGSNNFGGAGAPYLVLNNIPGELEGSWIRIIAETGLIGLIAMLALLFLLWSKATGLLKNRQTSIAQRVGALYCILFIPSFTLWGITHDTFANAVSLYLAFFLMGPILLSRRQRG